MHPELTGGAIKRILGGEDVPNAVIQLLGCKKIPGSGNDRYRLLISDGETGCPYAMLGTQLNSMVVNKELEKFTVVRVDKCVRNQVQPDKKVIILLSLTVLAPGAEVGEKLGNPTNAMAGNSESGANNDVPKVNYSTMKQQSVVSSTTANEMQADMNVHPISSLTPYQNKWTIKARITAKTTVRTWSNSRSEGKLFSVTFTDQSGEIRATAFNDAVDKFHDMLELRKVYYVTKGTLKTANKQYSNVKNDFEMTLNSDAQIELCEDNSSSIPMMQFDFVEISQIENHNKDDIVDVIGVCKSEGEIQTFTSRKDSKEYSKKDICLVDRSQKEVKLTIWGTDALQFDGSMNPVIALKGAKVSDFNGRSLTAMNSTSLQINPDIKEAHVLKGWFDREGCNISTVSISGKLGGGSGQDQWKTFAQVIGEQLGMGEKPDYFLNKCTVVMVRKENCMYMACPSEECNKKVIDLNNGLYRCEKCAREYGNFKWRLLLGLSIADFTENQWVTCFQESAEKILGIQSQDLGALKESDEEKYNEVLSDANFKSFNFKIRIQMENFKEDSRLKSVVFAVNPIDPAEYGRKLLNDIKQMQDSL